MSRRRKGTPLWLDLLILAVVAYCAWELVTNPDVHAWFQERCGWACR